MPDDRFEDRLRQLADQLAKSISESDIDDVAERLGVDPERARGLGDAIGSWLSDRASGQEPLFGGRAAGRPDDPRGEAAPGKARRSSTEPGASQPAAVVAGGPHPLDLPGDAQGRALSALDAGRWTVRPGTSELAATGVGAPPPGAGAAVDLVNELRARDWITSEGAVTLVGRQALLRWSQTAETPDAASG